MDGFWSRNVIQTTRELGFAEKITRLSLIMLPRDSKEVYCVCLSIKILTALL